jgi:hypothetical protein
MNAGWLGMIQNRLSQTCDFSCFLGKLSVLSISPLIIGRCYHPALECEVKANSLVSPIREFINWNIKEVFRSTRTCFVLLIFDHGSPLKGTPYLFLMKIKIVYIFRPSWSYWSCEAAREAVPKHGAHSIIFEQSERQSGLLMETLIWVVICR